MRQNARKWDDFNEFTSNDAAEQLSEQLNACDEIRDTLVSNCYVENKQMRIDDPMSDSEIFELAYANLEKQLAEHREHQEIKNRSPYHFGPPLKNAVWLLLKNEANIVRSMQEYSLDNPISADGPETDEILDTFVLEEPSSARMLNSGAPSILLLRHG